ncbi:MAG: hypothetical protein ACREX9_22445, partial [Gammaproteobacteria bacterium]
GVEMPFRAFGTVIPGLQPTVPVDPVELQEQLLRFADNFITATVAHVERLRRDDRPIDRAEALNLKLALSSDAYAVATGSNALASLVDMIVLTTVTRIRVENYWLPKVYGESARPILEGLRAQESQTWEYAKTVLKPDQQAELRGAIESWRKETASRPTSVSAFITIALVAEVTKAGRKKASSSPSSVFAMLDIDPLAGLDPAARELAQTRLFAERALYLGQRMPQLIGWQMELFTLKTAAIPEMRQLLANSTEIAASSDRLSRVVEQTPALLSSEREKIVAALKSQEQGLTVLSKELGQTLAQGTKVAESTDAALKTFHGVVAQFEAVPSKPASEPFRIQDYAETAVEVSHMAQRLTELLNALQPNLNPESFARLSAQADAIAERTQRRGHDVVDYAFRKALLFVALSAAIMVAAGLAFRFAGAKIARPSGRTPDRNA